MRMRRCLTLGLALALGASVLAGAGPARAAALALAPVFIGLVSPVFVTHAGDGSNRRFIVEQAGLIKVAQPGRGDDDKLP